MAVYVLARSRALVLGLGRQDTMRSSNAVVQICGDIYNAVGAFRVEAPHLAAFALETLRK